MQDDISDTQEGFVPNKIIIKPSQKHINRQDIELEKQKSIDFETKYIYGQGMLKKQPPQLHRKLLQIQQEYNDGQQKIKIKQKSEDLYKKFFSSNAYTLIYNRTRQRITQQQTNPFKNQISLQVLSSYQQSNFCQLKAFEYQQESQQIQFDSKFECGNLLWAFQNKQIENQFYLFLQNDTNTYGYNQWFYFAVKHVKKNVNYKFSILNFRKSHSFFKDGKKLAVFSLKQARKNGSSWRYRGKNITYGRSSIKIDANKSQKYFQLSFELDFQYDNDYILIAMNIPYSYSKMIGMIKDLEIKAIEKNISWETKSIAHTIANNCVPQLTITNHQKQFSEPNTEIKKKKIILILARQHPGQTWSSYVMESFLQQLIDDSQQSKYILDNYIIKAYPMINIDGVIYGNFRCDLAGMDMNRKWKKPSKILQPQIYNIKQYLQKLAEENQIQCCLDLHGHSKQYNIFCYSCKGNDNINCRVFPYILSQLDSSFFFPSCTFGINKYKQSTARATIFNIIKTFNVLTIECSFYGNKDNDKIKVFDPKNIKDFSANILKALKIYLNQQKQRKQAENIIRDKLGQFLQYEKKYGDGGGSQSDPSADQMNIQEKIGTIFPKDIIEQNPSVIKRLKRKKQINPIKQIISTGKRFSKTIEQTYSDSLNQKLMKSQKKSKELTIERKYPKNYIHIEKRKVYQNQIVPRQTMPKMKSIGIMDIKPPQIQNRCKRDTLSSIPYFLRQQTRIPLKIRQDSQEYFKTIFQPSQNSIQHDKFKYFRVSAHKTKQKVQQKKLDFLQQDDHEQLPTLCILSEKKKQYHLQRIKQKLKKREEQKSYMKKNIIMERKQFKRIKIQAPRQRLDKKDKSSVDFLTKIWKDNFTRYGKGLNSFYENGF